LQSNNINNDNGGNWDDGYSEMWKLEQFENF
jgi:hypothetical protein